MNVNAQIIKSYVKQCGVKSILQTKPANFSGLSLCKLKMLADDKFSTRIGKHKIPKYLYHITGEKRYQKMLSCGKLELSNCDVITGFYMIELKNFFKFWNKSKFLRNEDLRESLLRHVRRINEKIVVLRIPTEKIDKNKLLVRSLKQRCSITEEDYNKIVSDYKQFSSISDKKFAHIVKGDSAINSKLYNNRKEAIEYIYPHEIDISLAEIVGSSEIKAKNNILRKMKYLITDFKDFIYPPKHRNFSDYIERYNPSKIDAIATFKELFKNGPEKKALINLKK